MPRFKRDVAPLLERSVASLTLAIELFNRPSEVGRSHTVVILLQHAFEMILKAALLQHRRPIAERDGHYTFSFTKVLRIAQQINVLTADEANALAILDTQRDQVQHFWAEISEDVLYVHAQSAVTLFDRLLKANFSASLADHVPSRVLPVAASPPTDLVLLFERELAEVDALLEGGTRKTALAIARLRSILAFTIRARPDQSRVSEEQLVSAVRERCRGVEWEIILPEIAQLKLATEGSGIPVTLRISKGAPIAVRVVKAGEPVVGTLLKQEVDVWDKFNLNLSDLSKKLGLTTMRVLALIYEMGIQDDPESYHVLQKGKTILKGYSKKALEALRQAHAENRHIEAWEHQRHRLSGGRQRAR